MYPHNARQVTLPFTDQQHWADHRDAAMEVAVRLVNAGSTYAAWRRRFAIFCRDRGLPQADFVRRYAPSVWARANKQTQNKRDAL